MHLKDYLEKYGIPVASFARKVGVSRATIETILDKKRDLRLSVAIKIEEVTDRCVTCRDLVPERLLVKLKEKEQPKKKREYKKKTPTQ
jgi:predicted transcriptional regulator